MWLKQEDRMETDFQLEVARLVAAAMERPGVADAIRAFSAGDQVVSRQSALTQQAQSKWIVSAGTSAGVPRQPA